MANIEFDNIKRQENIQTANTAGNTEKTLEVEKQNAVITAIRLLNYKAFEDSGWIEFEKITILLGCNSAGKSSVYQVLRMLKICFEKLKNEQRFYGMDDLADEFGSISEMICSRAKKKEASVQFKITLDGDCLVYQIHLGIDEKKNEYISSEIWKNKKKVEILGEYRNINVFFLQKKDDSIMPEGMFEVAAVVSALTKFSRNLNYMLPVRMNANRRMFFSGKNQHEIGIRGENTYDILFGLSEAEIREQKIINEWLKKFGYEYYFKLEDKKNSGCFMLKNMKNKIETNIVDNGFGISQSLPIAVAVAMISKGMLLIDSPEAHLQTNMQSELGDLFLHIVDTEGKVLLETGSEYLLLRLQRRVAEGKINPKQLAIYFIENGKDGMARCEKVGVGEDGNLKSEQKTFQRFFSSDYEDMVAIDRIKYEKHLKEKTN